MMANLISPKPVSYLQQNAPYNPYSRGPVQGYPETPPLNSSALGHHQQFIPNGGVHDDTKIYQLVINLLDPDQRESALLELSKKREQYDDLALVLWHSFGEFLAAHSQRSAHCFAGVMPALLQEIVSVYPLLSPPNLTAHVSNRVCNALALLQCVASHSDTRQLFLSGRQSSAS